MTGEAWYWTIWKNNLKFPVTFTDWVTSPASSLPFVAMESGSGWASTTATKPHAVICEIDASPLVADSAQGAGGYTLE